MLWVLALVKKIPYQIYILIGLVLSFFFYGLWQRHLGEQEVQAKWDASVARGKTLVEQLKKQQVITNTVVETKYIDRIKVVREKGDTIVKEIPKYIPANTPDLPYGFRVLHDAAATNTLPGSAEGVTGPAVPLTTATETIAKNYELCHEYFEHLLAWQNWYEAQKQLANSHSKDK